MRGRCPGSTLKALPKNGPSIGLSTPIFVRSACGREDPKCLKTYTAWTGRRVERSYPMMSAQAVR
jgi:hypothetical protein